MPPVPLVAFTRGAVVESVHYGSIAVVEPAGRLVASAGDPERVTTMRSAAKPFQAMAVVESGAFDRFAGTPPELALIAGSHSGELRHTGAVEAMLRRAGLSVEALLTGVQPPFHEATREALARSGQSPTALHHNCSGKHCGMLWACVHQGWDERTYFRPDHPLQRRIRTLIAEVAGCSAEDLAVAIDGCGAPTFALPLHFVARAFARLAQGDGSVSAHAQSALRVRTAMADHPEMVGGEGRFDTALMVAVSGRLVAKAGAEGGQGAALPEQEWGVAVKIEDGNSRATPVALVAALRQLGAMSEAEAEALVDYARPTVRNFRGEIVGEGRPVFRLSS